MFLRRNSKKVSSKDSDGSQKKDKDNRQKNDLLDRADEGLGALARGLQSAKNDTEAKVANLQKDVKVGIESIRHIGSHIPEKAKDETADHAEATPLKEQEQGSVEQESKNMEALSAVIDNVKNSSPEFMEKAKEEIESLAGALHLGKHESTDKGPETQEAAKEGEGSAAEPAAGEEIQAVSNVQQTTRDATVTPTNTAAAATTAEETKPEAEKDDPSKRLDFAGFFAMLFERFCSPAAKKKD